MVCRDFEMASASSSLKEYLKKYSSEGADGKSKSKKRKKPTNSTSAAGIKILDEDAAWQAEIKDESSQDDSADEKPQISEDVEVKRMKRMEEAKIRRPYLTVSNDGSGWVTVSEAKKAGLHSNNSSPSRQSHPDTSHYRKVRHDSPDEDLSPSREDPNSARHRDSVPAKQYNNDLSDQHRLAINKTDKLLPDSERRVTNKSETKVEITERTNAGLRTGKDLKEEINLMKKEESQRFSKMDPSVSGRGAETVYRDKRGKRLEGVDEFLKLQQRQTKPEDKPLEWGKGLTQKREAEARQVELELEKNKPFARSRDDPELEKMLKERVRWGDPMAHLVKKTYAEPVLEDLTQNEKIKESGFIVPQEIPSHSWLKRGIDPPANRYGIKPGRHWDGVDRSNGFERELFKRQNDKRATEMEAYLWSVSDM